MIASIIDAGLAPQCIMRGFYFYMGEYSKDDAVRT